MEPAVVEAATVVESAAVVESGTAVESAAAVEPAAVVGSGTATVHLRVGSSDTAKKRECSDTRDCEFLHWRRSHSRTSSLL